MKIQGREARSVAVAVGPWRPIGELVSAAEAAGRLGGDPPVRALLFPAGKWVLADMTLRVTERSNKAVVAEFRKRGIDIVFDYEHQTLEAAEKGIPAPASGWVKDVTADAAGIWADKITWTEKAAAMIRAGEYRYYSPVAFYDSDTLEVLSLHSVALTNTPRTNNQTPLTARAAASLIEQFQKGREEGMKKWVQILASLLRKAATSKPADLVAEAKQLVESLESDGAEPAGSDATSSIATSLGFAAAGTGTVPDEIATLIGLESGAPIAKVKATILTLQNPTDKVDKAEYDKVVASNQKLQQSIDATSKTGEVDKLVAANRNKLSPALEKSVRAIAATNLADAKAIVDELPVLIAAGQGGAPAHQQPPAQGGESSEMLVEVGDGDVRIAEPNSASVAASCRAIMKEKGVSYAEANEIRKQREAAESAE